MEKDLDSEAFLKKQFLEINRKKSIVESESHKCIDFFLTSTAPQWRSRKSQNIFKNIFSQTVISIMYRIYIIIISL